MIPASQSEPQQYNRCSCGCSQTHDFAKIKVEGYDDPPVRSRPSEDFAIRQICETNFADVNSIVAFGA